MASTGKFRRELLPAAGPFLRKELGQHTRPNSQGWALFQPPCHKSKSKRSFSANVITGAYCCHAGCGKGGDLVSFVRWRYSLSFADACRELGCWDETGTTSRSEIRRQRQARAREQAEAEAEAERYRRAAIDKRDWLHLLERLYRDSNARLTGIRKGAPESYKGEEEVLWGILADALPQVRTAAAEYAQVTGVTIAE
jgi:hypothetical protein